MNELKCQSCRAEIPPGFSLIRMEMGIEHDGFFRKLFFCLMMIDNNQIDSLTRKNLCLLEGVRATIQSNDKFNVTEFEPSCQDFL